VRPQQNLNGRIATLRMTILAAGGEYVPWGAAYEYAGDLDEIITVVRESILPHDPAAARDLIADFFSRDKAILESCADSCGAVGEVFREAAEVFAATARAAKDPAAALAIVHTLLREDSYGVRRFLINGIPRFLDKAQREILLTEWWEAVEIEPEDSGARHARVLIQQLAEACKDPVLYERAVSFGRELEKFPLLAINLARQYLLRNKFSEALDRLPVSTPTRAHIQDDVEQIQVDCFKGLGRMDECREVLHTRVLRTGEYSQLREFLATIAPRERKAAEGKILKAILSGDCTPLAKARLFLDVGDAGTCSQLVLANASSFDGRFYPEIARMARGLEASHPLAATALYRRLAETILARALAKNYGHAVGYLRSIERLAHRINRWKPLANHVDYVAELRDVHRMKSSLWKLWKPK